MIQSITLNDHIIALPPVIALRPATCSRDLAIMPNKERTGSREQVAGRRLSNCLSGYKNLILCADDYGQNQSISEGIIHLANHGRINAISCMTNAEDWSAMHRGLRPIQQSTYIGLHVNVTDGSALSGAWKKYHGNTFLGLPTILKKAYLRQLNKDAIVAEIHAQLDAYTHSMNAYPDFIDGHQHVHQLPLIRDALFKVYADLPQTIFFRKTSNGWGDANLDGFPKRQLIALLGGMAFAHQLAQKNIPCNTSFSGIYDFKQSEHYRHYFKRFLSQSREGGLIMCHPGFASEDKNDPLYQYRKHELKYFMSDEFLSDVSGQSYQLKKKAP